MNILLQDIDYSLNIQIFLFVCTGQTHTLTDKNIYSILVIFEYESVT